MSRIHLSIAAALLALVSTAAAQNVPPVVTSQIADFTAYAGTPVRSIDLATAFNDPDASVAVRMTTVLGTMDIALFGQQAPVTVTNFLNYIDQGRFFLTDPTTQQPASSFVHRSIPGFIIQGGGFIGTVNPANTTIQPTVVLAFSAIQNEPGISNTRGTIAMAQSGSDANSATSQWFINLADNGGPPNNLDIRNMTSSGAFGPYTVFGEVASSSMTVLDDLAAVPTYNFGVGTAFSNFPLRNYNGTSNPQVSNLISIPGIERIAPIPGSTSRPLTFSVTSTAPAIANATISGSKLLVSALQTGDAQFTVTATDMEGAPVSQTFTVHVVNGPGRLIQLSTRMQIGTGDNVLIGGFIMSGASPKLLMVRALGPSTGLGGALADPVLELHDSTGAVIASNDNWGSASNPQDVSDFGIAPASPNESAILMTVPSDATFASYTAIVKGASDTTGIGLVEVYDLDSGPSSTLLNISTRGQVNADQNVLIGGFFVGGSQSKRVLVRAIGPSLASTGVSNPLADPVLELRDGNAALLQQNDDWGSSPDHAEIQSSGFAPANAKESALIQLLPAAPYTAIVRGVNNTTGVGSVEIYQLP